MAARIVVGVVLLVAGASKARDRTWPAAAARFGLSRPAALALPWMELALGALLVTQVGGRWTSLAAMVLMVAFTAVVAVRVVRHDDVPCACFGARSAAPVTGRTMVRNLAFVALAAVGAFVQ